MAAHTKDRPRHPGFEREYFEEVVPELRHDNPFSYYIPFVVVHSKSEAISWLDIGCSFGNLVSYARRTNMIGSRRVAVDSFGIDISRYAVAKSEAKGYVVVGDAECLPFKDQSLDVVSAHAVLEHLASPQACLDEIARVIKPDGLLIIVTPTNDPLELSRDPTHISVHEAEYWIDGLTRRGFEVVYPYWPVFMTFHSKFAGITNTILSYTPNSTLNLLDRVEEPFRHVLGRLSLDRGHLHLVAKMRTNQ